MAQKPGGPIEVDHDLGKGPSWVPGSLSGSIEARRKGGKGFEGGRVFFFIVGDGMAVGDGFANATTNGASWGVGGHGRAPTGFRV